MLHAKILIYFQFLAYWHYFLSIISMHFLFRVQYLYEERGAVDILTVILFENLWQPNLTIHRSFSSTSPRQGLGLVSQYMTRLLAWWPGFDSRQSRIFLFDTTSRPTLGSTQSPIQWVPVVLPGVRWLRHEAHHSPPSSADVKNAWSYTFTPPYVCMAWCLLKYQVPHNQGTFHHHHHHHQWRYNPESDLGLPYGFRDRYITMWVISPTINLVLVILIQPPETYSGEASIDI
jgi:hypothetical protein